MLKIDLKLTFDQIYFLNQRHIFKTSKNIWVSSRSPKKRPFFGGSSRLERDNFGYVSGRQSDGGTKCDNYRKGSF